MTARYIVISYDPEAPRPQWFVRDTALGYSGGPYPSRAAAERAAREFNRANRRPRKLPVAP